MTCRLATSLKNAEYTQVSLSILFSINEFKKVQVPCCRREMATEERQLVYRHRGVYRRHEEAAVTGSKVVNCTVQTAARR